MPWALYECHYRLGLFSFIPMSFLLLLRSFLLPHILGDVCLLWREACVSFWDCIAFFVLSWNGHFPDKGHYPYSPLGSYSCHFFSFPWARCHVGPLGSLPLSLGFTGPLISFLPLILSMGLLAINSIMLAHWACYLFSWASLVLLFHLYLLFFSWVCWLLFLPCQLIGFTNLISPFVFLFLSISLIVALLLPLGLS